MRFVGLLFLLSALSPAPAPADAALDIHFFTLWGSATSLNSTVCLGVFAGARNATLYPVVDIAYQSLPTGLIPLGATHITLNSTLLCGRVVITNSSILHHSIVGVQYRPVCSPGFRQGSSGLCIACPAGTYSASNDAPVCLACPAGTYLDSVGGTMCTPCRIGTYSAAGAFQCTISTIMPPAIVSPAAGAHVTFPFNLSYYLQNTTSGLTMQITPGPTYTLAAHHDQHGRADLHVYAEVQKNLAQSPQWFIASTYPVAAISLGHVTLALHATDVYGATSAASVSFFLVGPLNATAGSAGSAAAPDTGAGDTSDTLVTYLIAGAIVAILLVPVYKLGFRCGAYVPDWCFKPPINKCCPIKDYSAVSTGSAVGVEMQ